MSGKAGYTALVQTGRKPTDINKRVRAGDKMDASASMTSSAVTVTVKDVTGGWRKTFKASRFVPAFADYGLDWVYNRTTGVVYRVPNFGKATFSHSLAGGKPIGTRTLQKHNRTIAGTRDITTGPLHNAGTSFGCTFVHS